MGRSTKRKILKLSSQQKAECGFIRGRVTHFMNILTSKEINDCCNTLQIRITGYPLEELKHHKIHLEELFSDTDIKSEKVFILQGLLRIEQLINDSNSNDFGRYTKMALQIKPNDGHFNFSRGLYLEKTHEKEFDYIDYYRKAFEFEESWIEKEKYWWDFQNAEACREFYTGSLTEIKHLVQLDHTPCELEEPKWELYKISFSFAFVSVISEIAKLKGTNNRVLFQNADGNINMGIWFNDPDIEIYDIFWLNVILREMKTSLQDKEGLIYIDEESNTVSCYVELHSHPVGMDGQNHIIAITPLKFLPIKEFEKSQKSFDETPKTELQIDYISSISNWLTSWIPGILNWPRFSEVPARQHQEENLSKLESMEKIKSEVFEKKERAHELKEMGNLAFEKKNYDEAEKLYSEAIELNIGSGRLWTSRATCRNAMKKYKEAISDCDTALSIDPKCTRSIIEKGNSLLGLERFDEAKECYTSLCSLGRPELADTHLKNLHESQFPQPKQPIKQARKKSNRHKTRTSYGR